MRREFFIRFPEVIAKEDELFRGKIKANTEKGEIAYETGAIEPFKGHPEKANTEAYVVSLEPTEASKSEVMERIVYPLRNIMERHGLEGVFPEIGDMAPHVTLQPAGFKNLSPEQMQKIREELDENRYLHMIGRILTGIEFDLDRVIASGRDIYLCASEFRSDLYPIYKARQLIKRVYQRYSTSGEIGYGQTSQDAKGVIPVNYDDIVHISVGRIVGLPEGSKIRDLITFGEDVNREVGDLIEKRPVHIEIASVYEGISRDFVQRMGGKLV